MKASKENVETCNLLIESTIAHIKTYPAGIMGPEVDNLMLGLCALTSEALDTCKNLVNALQAKVEELEAQLAQSTE